MMKEKMMISLLQMWRKTWYKRNFNLGFLLVLCRNILLLIWKNTLQRGKLFTPTQCRHLVRWVGCRWPAAWEMREVLCENSSCISMRLPLASTLRYAVAIWIVLQPLLGNGRYGTNEIEYIQWQAWILGRLRWGRNPKCNHGTVRETEFSDQSIRLVDNVSFKEDLVYSCKSILKGRNAIGEGEGLLRCLLLHHRWR